MAVKDIVAGAEMFLRTAGIADENMRRMLIQRIQEQAMQKSQLELQNEQGFQQYATDFMKPKMPDTSGASGYVPEGATPQGMTQQPSMMSPEFLQGAMKYLQPAQAVTALTALSTRESPEQTFARNVILARIKASGQKGPTTAIAKYIEDNPNATPEEIAAYHKSLQKDPASTNVRVDFGDKGLTKLSEEMGKSLSQSYDDSRKVANSLYNLQQSKELLQSPMITGAGANYLLALGKGLSQLGIHFADDAIANTEAYAASMGNQVGVIIKQFGAGTGLSDADRDYAEKIVGGKITLNKQSIQKITDILEKGYKNVIKEHNKNAKQVMDRPESKDLPYSLIVEDPTENVSNIGRFKVRVK